MQAADKIQEKAQEDYAKECQRNPQSDKRLDDFKTALTKEEIARIHFDVRKREILEKTKRPQTPLKRRMPNKQIKQIWLSPLKVLEMTKPKVPVIQTKEREI